MSDGAIRHSSPHPPEAENKHKCGGCRLQAELDQLRRGLDAGLMAQAFHRANGHRWHQRQSNPYVPDAMDREMAAAIVREYVALAAREAPAGEPG